MNYFNACIDIVCHHNGHTGMTLIQNGSWFQLTMSNILACNCCMGSTAYSGNIEISDAECDQREDDSC